MSHTLKSRILLTDDCHIKKVYKDNHLPWDHLWSLDIDTKRTERKATTYKYGLSGVIPTLILSPYLVIARVLSSKAKIGEEGRSLV